MKVGVFEKSLPIRLECICKEKGVYNIYIPGSLNIKLLKYVLTNPPKNARFYTVYDSEGKDRWHSMIEKMGKELGIKWYRFEEKDGFVHYIIDLFDEMPEEYR
jgi:hypothetical protein